MTAGEARKNSALAGRRRQFLHAQRTKKTGGQKVAR
jgi:hypothetical protein